MFSIIVSRLDGNTEEVLKNVNTTVLYLIFFKNSDASKVISTPARRRSIHAEIYGCCAKQLMRQDIEHRQS